MERKDCKIPPNKGIIVALMICVIVSCFLLFNRPTHRIPGHMLPEVLENARKQKR